MREMTVEEMIINLKTMKVVLGLCKTERDTIDNAIDYIQKNEVNRSANKHFKDEQNAE